MKRWWLIALVLVLIYILISGCTVFPASAPYILEGNELYGKQWQIGNPTKSEVLDRSMPIAVWEDGNTFIYSWRESGQYLEMYFFLAAGPIERVWENYIGLIRFDEKDILKSIWVGESPPLMTV